MKHALYVKEFFDEVKLCWRIREKEKDREREREREEKEIDGQNLQIFF